MPASAIGLWRRSTSAPSILVLVNFLVHRNTRPSFARIAIQSLTEDAPPRGVVYIDVRTSAHYSDAIARQRAQQATMLAQMPHEAECYGCTTSVQNCALLCFAATLARLALHRGHNVCMCPGHNVASG